jgi:ABC-type nickel/cobalt efflux system permease component RcnA
MKATIISLIAIAIILLFVARISIQFSPFKITFDRPWFAIGWILIVIGVAFIQIDSETKGYRKAYKEATEIVDQEFQNISKNNSDEQIELPEKN